MIDRENIIKAIDICLGHGKCNDCPYCLSGKGYTTMNCRDYLFRGVLALLKEQKEEIENLKQTAQSMMEGICLLKEQEAVEPIFIENPYTHLPVSYCSQCREPIDKYIVGNPYKMTKFCHYCGKAVKWDEFNDL